MNVCVQKLNLTTNSEIDNQDESGLSVTSSEDENDDNKTMKQNFPNMKENDYGNINELLISAIEHYKLDANMYKLLLDRSHAP